jgi:hypothetical protein
VCGDEEMEVRGIGDLKLSSSVVHREVLPETEQLPCAARFAESQISGSWQTTALW